MVDKYAVIYALLFTVNIFTFTAACPSLGIAKLNQLFGGKVKPLGEITLKKNVWKVAPFINDKENPSAKFTIATTERFKLACVPKEEARQQCADLAKVVSKESLYYVELLKDFGSVLESFCTTDLEDIHNHVQHVCDYKGCTDTACTPYFVFDMRVALESKANADDMCRTVAISIEDTGPVVQKSSDCDTSSHKAKDSVLQDCKEHGGKVSSKSQRRWKKKKHLKILCSVVENQSP